MIDRKFWLDESGEPIKDFFTVGYRLYLEPLTELEKKELMEMQKKEFEKTQQPHPLDMIFDDKLKIMRPRGDI